MIDNDYLSQKAKAHGIDLIGIVNKEALENFANKVKGDFKGSKLAFFNGSIDERLDTVSLFKDFRGMIAFGVSYASSLRPPFEMKDRVTIAKSAYGEDYHNVLRSYAQKMMKNISEEHPCDYVICIDTGLFLDRVAAYAAGIGFYGKNGFIINENFGSYIFLGYILTGIPLDNKAELLASRCGDCRKCLEACPCGAYDEGRLNFEKCISYMTQKGMGNDKTDSVYGCDICQQVCPYNKTVPMDVHEEFRETAENAFPKAEDILEMGKEGFMKRYGSSSLAWRGYNKLLFNCESIIKRREKKE